MNEQEKVADVLPERIRPQAKKPRINVGAQIILILLLLFVLLPFYIVLITSLESVTEANQANFKWWPEHGLTPKSYVDLFFAEAGGVNLFRSLWNTIWIYTPGIIVGIFTSTLAAFAYAKLPFKLRDPMFAVLMATMMLPNCMSTMASFLMYDQIGWVNTPWPLMIPRMFGAIGVVFFIRQYYAGVPDDIMNAAKLDGASNWSIFFRIMLPVARPAMFAQFILQFIAGYNDYMGPLIYLQDSEMTTIQIALVLFEDPYEPQWPVRMAGCLMSMVPLLVLYLFAQKAILNGIAMSSGLKG